MRETPVVDETPLVGAASGKFPAVRDQRLITAGAAPYCDGIGGSLMQAGFGHAGNRDRSLIAVSLLVISFSQKASRTLTPASSSAKSTTRARPSKPQPARDNPRFQLVPIPVTT
jgi:hypothetical protein